MYTSCGGMALTRTWQSPVAALDPYHAAIAASDAICPDGRSIGRAAYVVKRKSGPDGASTSYFNRLCRADLDAAFNQLRQYALALENPPLLIVSDMARFRIRTNWTNSVSVTHGLTLDDLTDGAVRDTLKWAMSDPERLRPGETRQGVTERAAATFAELAQGLRDRGHDPQTVAHFVNRLVFCMFAEDVGLLPGNMFTRMLEQARRRPDEFTELASDLFRAMSVGGSVGFEAVDWFNGGLFDDDTALPLDREGIETALKAAALDWSEIDPSILGTLFERGLDPDKRSQLGAHYTDRDKIMRIVDPVIVRPLLAEWETAKDGIAAKVERADAAGLAAVKTRLRRQADQTLRTFLERLRRTYRSSIPASADLVCYWFAKAGVQVAEGKTARAGLVATNSIRGGNNRPVLDRIVADGAIFDAWPDEPWVIDGAAVRVSLVCFASKEAGLPVSLNGADTACIHADLTGGGIDLTRAGRLVTNASTAFLGVNKNGAFDIPGDVARDWLRHPANPNGRPNADVLKPRFVGMDLVRRSSDQWIVDFGSSMSEADAALYEAPFAHVAEHVKPARATNRIKALRENWWRHWRPRPAMWQALKGMTRCIATPTLAKHRLFVWLDTRVRPDHQLIVIARDDDTTFGILHSRFHEAWSLRLGTWLGKGNDPRYTPTTTFETFPFPEGLSPDIPAANYSNDSRATAIAEAARRLVELRERWLNPPEWVAWTDEPAPGYPKRPVACDEAAAKGLKARTLTNLYNACPQWLADAHSALDGAVAAAYGWDMGIGEEDALRELLTRNLLERESVAQARQRTGEGPE